MADELTREPGDAGDSGLLDQAALDALLAAAADDAVLDTPPSVGSDAPLSEREEEPLGEVDAEGLLLQTPSTPMDAVQDPAQEAVGVGIAESAAMEGAESVDAMDFDAMFSVAPEKYQTPPAPEPAVELPPLSPTPAEPLGESDMSQAEIDAILQAATTPPPAPKPEPAPEAAEAPAAAAEGDLLDQAELDRLMAQSRAAAEAAPTEREAAPAEHVVLDSSELDALVAGIADDAPLNAAELDAPVVDAAGADSISLSVENVESLLGSLGATLPEPAVEAIPVAEALVEPAAPPVAPPPAAPASDVSQDMIDALIAAAVEPPASAAEVGSENLAAAATAVAPEIAAAPEQDDLARLIEESRRRQLEQQARELAAAEVPAQERPRRVPRFESPLLNYLKENGARAVASLAAGILVSTGTFVWLSAQQARTPDLALLAMQRGSALETAMDEARKMIDEGEYARAATLLESKIEDAPAGRERTDAAFLRLEALYRAVPENAALSRYDAVQTEIDGLLAQAGAHPRVPEALHWKALLHERGELPFAALDNYEALISQYPDTPHMDEILVEAARLALELGFPDKAARYADRAVQEFPQSEKFAEAKLLQGDAYARAGQHDAARQLYAESLSGEPSAPLRAEAVLRLGRLAFNEGNYEGAIAQIRDYLNKTTTAEGNDAAYLLLAEALRKVKRDGEARDVLNDLLRFFPESKLSAQAYVELAETLEALGERKAALRIANEGEERFPGNPKVLACLGELQGLDGNPFSAATTLLAANDAGADNPEVLLTAARHFRTAGMLDQAQSTYGKLLEEYGGSPESFLGGVELAELTYERGDAKRALERLQMIATATEGSPQQLPALLAMAKIYDAIGLPARVAEVSQKAAGLTDDPEVLARAAAALIKAGSLTEGQKVSDRVDLTQVSPATAYTLLSALGTGLLAVDPPRGIAKLEEAYSNYPEARTAENDFVLLQAYLKAERAAGARRVVMDMAAREAEHPEDAPYLLDAAATWGDYLYAKGDYRAAADAFAMADAASAGPQAQTIEGKRTDHGWPRYQRANALLKLGDLPGSLALYTQISETSEPWAKEAAVKADYARLQLRARGEKVPELADAAPAVNSAAAPTAPPAPAG